MTGVTSCRLTYDPAPFSLFLYLQFRPRLGTIFRISFALSLPTQEFFAIRETPKSFANYLFSISWLFWVFKPTSVRNSGIWRQTVTNVVLSGRTNHQSFFDRPKMTANTQITQTTPTTATSPYTNNVTKEKAKFVLQNQVFRTLTVSILCYPMLPKTDMILANATEKSQFFGIFLQQRGLAPSLQPCSSTKRRLSF